MKIEKNPIPINHSNKKVVEHIPEPYRKVARGMEQQFVEFMIGEMRKTVNKQEPDDQASKFYKSMLDHETAKTIVKNNEGIGLQKVILDQIYPKYLRHKSYADNSYLKNNIEIKKEPASGDKQ